MTSEKLLLRYFKTEAMFLQTEVRFYNCLILTVLAC